MDILIYVAYFLKIKVWIHGYKSIPDNAGCFSTSSCLSVKVSRHCLLLHWANECDPIDIPEKQPPVTREVDVFLCVFVSVWMLSHGEVVNEGSFGDLHVEADALGGGAWVDHGALDYGVSEPRRDSALHLIALNCDVIALNCLHTFTDRTQYINQTINIK